jgi:hypothetical protein
MTAPKEILDLVERFDRLTPGLAVDDKALKEIIRNLYYPDSPYELSVLPADILGQVYEQFLGKVIRLTAYLRFFGQYLEKFPVRPINFSDPADKTQHDRMVQQVEQMLSLNKQLAAAKTGHEQTALQRQIEAIDRQIDQLVYKLYGLTEEEIRIVEDSTRETV